MFESLKHLIEYRALHEGERIFAASPEKNVSLTYKEFYEIALKLAAHLQDQGLHKGDRVGLILSNGLEWAIAFFGILLAEGAVAPFNPKFTSRELGPMLKEAEVQMIISDEETIRAGYLQSLEGTDGAQSYVTGARNLDPLKVAVVGSKENTGLKSSALQASDEALLLFTSGSTGVPKGVVLTHRNLLAEAEFIKDGHRLTQTDIVLCILPFFHINGLVITLVTTAYSGGKAVIPRKFSASKFWGWVEEYKITWFSAVPTILSILLSKENHREVDSASVRFARSASSSLPVAILEKFENLFEIPVIEAYGLSEAGSQIATNPLPPAARKAGSVGLPIGNKIKIVNETGRIVPYGVEGEVLVKGDNVTAGYLHNPQANKESFKDGWFYTGDLGYFDEEGYLYLSGRRKELINRAGEKISPREVDEVIYKLPQIETAGVVGVPDTLFGEKVIAFIKLRSGMKLNSEAVVAHCSSFLADYKIPEAVYFIDDFPKGPNGKIQRFQLAELYKKLRSSRNMETRRQEKKTYSVDVDKEACKECGYCIEVCPVGIFTASEYLNAKGYRAVTAQFEERCIGCKRCFIACPDFAIEVVKLQEEGKKDEKIV